ncbi:MAG: cation:proton antiporter [Micropruina sp.]|uniref:cation:proton antiporter n=1 Tax=Micropruina sp. TaxID=2737536 RepID=UPI0039E45032
MTFAVLALICAVAMLGPVVSLNRMVHIPVVIGELAVGVLLGRTGTGAINPDDPTLEFLAQVGFALVMFVAGTHVPLREPAMIGGLRNGLLRALGVAAIAAPLGLLIASVWDTGHGPLYAVLIASSSASIVMPALGGAAVTARSGLEMLVQLAIADAACIVVLPLVLDPSRALTAGLGALGVLALAALFFVVLRWAERSGRRRHLHELSEKRGLAMELRITLTMLFTLAALAATVRVSVMLAGFAMGLAMAAVGEPRRIANQTFALTEGFFAPIFFVWLGSSLDLRELAGNPQAIGLGVALGVAAVLAHGLLALTRQPLPVAVCTAAQLGVPVGAAALGTTTGVLRPGESTAMLLGALLTIGVVAVFSDRLIRAVTAPAAPASGR